MRAALALLVVTACSASCSSPQPPITRASWQPVTTGSSAGLRGVHAVDGNLVWATGSDGTVLRTTDGGTTWTSVADGFQPRGQRAAVAWVPGRRETLITVGRTGTDYSLDGGRTWAPLSDDGYCALCFTPTGEGWAVVADGRAARLAYEERVSVSD